MEKKSPNCVVRTWLQEKYCGELSFQGRQLKSDQLSVTMPHVLKLASNNQTELLLQRDGSGHLYYSLYFQYSPKNLEVEANDYGFHVTRTFYHVEEIGAGKSYKIEKKDKLSLDPSTGECLTISIGKLVWVEIQFQVPKKRNHVGVIDKLPGGFVSDSKLTRVARAGTEAWFDYENLRDERTEAFAEILQEGVFTFTYICRASMKGTYFIPPTRVEETYRPQIFGTSNSSKISIL